jgi:hypothetical protein
MAMVVFTAAVMAVVLAVVMAVTAAVTETSPVVRTVPASTATRPKKR